MQFFWGVLLADLQNHEPTTALIARRPRASALLSGALVLLGLALASFPEAHEERAPWSRALARLLAPLAAGGADLPRLGTGLGLELVSAGIVLSPGVLQRALSGRHLLFLGRMSFAVYLLHGPLMRTTLAWMLYGVHAPPPAAAAAERLAYPGGLALIAWQVVWLPMLYGVASLWMAYVDPWCEKMTNGLVEYVKLEASEKMPVLPRYPPASEAAPEIRK